MGICKRAPLYLIHKKGRAALLFLIFFFVSAFLLICFYVGAALYIRPYTQMTMKGGSLSVGTTPVITQQSINEVIAATQGQVKVYNTEHYDYAKSEQLHFLPGADDSEASNMGKVIGVRDSESADVFLNEEYTLIAGRHIQQGDENKILISAELASSSAILQLKPKKILSKIILSEME